MQSDDKPGPRNRSGHGPRITTTVCRAPSIPHVLVIKVVYHQPSDSIPSLVLGSSVLTDEPVSFANLSGTLSRKGTQALSHSGGDSSAEEDYASSSPARSPASPESPPARHLRRLSYSRERIYVRPYFIFWCDVLFTPPVSHTRDSGKAARRSVFLSLTQKRMPGRASTSSSKITTKECVQVGETRSRRSSYL